MSIIKNAAASAGLLPGGVRALSYVPLSWRTGRGYKRFLSEAKAFELQDIGRKKEWIYGRMRSLVVHGEKNVPFYRKFYHEAGFSSKELQGYEDLTKIPIITKSDFQRFPLHERTSPGAHAKVSNTGGTSGQPLSFMVEPFLKGKEWSYMHRIWKRKSYGPGYLKLRFRGLNLGTDLLRYNPVESEFLVNTYLEHDVICKALESLIRHHPIHYLHGYPSAIYGFAAHCGEHFRKTLMEPLQKTLKGIFLGSEYPAPHYRETIEEVFGRSTMSWYGHSEMAVLAGENGTPYEYEPFQSYGFVEAIESHQGTSKRLIGTNYHGLASPFIRYDTGDLIDPLAVNQGLLQSFRIAEGRIGDFVVDSKDHPVSLTSLIFGRHHSIFEHLQHLQVAQEKPGEVLLIATIAANQGINENRFWQEFDTANVDIRFAVKFVCEPYRTPAGKVPLLVPFPDES